MQRDVDAHGDAAVQFGEVEAMTPRVEHLESRAGIRQPDAGSQLLQPGAMEATAVVTHFHPQDIAFASGGNLHVPFVDAINTMLDESLPLTVPEFEEWGNPKKKAEFDYMYDHVPGGVVTLIVHPQCIGHGSRIAMLQRFIEHCLSRPGTRFATLGNVVKEHLADTNQAASG